MSKEQKPGEPKERSPVLPTGLAVVRRGLIGGKEYLFTIVSRQAGKENSIKLYGCSSKGTLVKRINKINNARCVKVSTKPNHAS